jgi:signal transduction histidine kinase
MSSVATPSSASSVETRLAVAILVVGAGLFGLWTEQQAFGLNDPRRWVPDFVVGAVFVGVGAGVYRRSRGTALLLGAAGVAWWAGNVFDPVVYLHRAFFTHAVVAYPGWRTKSWAGATALALVYAAMLAPQSGTDLATAVLGVGLAAMSFVTWVQSSGRTRRYRQVAMEASIVFLIGTAGGALVRSTIDSRQVLEPLLLLYEASLIGATLLLGYGLRQSRPAPIADMVVELDSPTAGTVRDRLARLVGDPELEVGFSEDGGPYRDALGEILELPDADSDRVATVVERDDRSRAVIVHDRSIVEEGALLTAVAAVTRLSTENAILNAETRRQLEELVASRRRLLVAGDEERRRLEERLRKGAERELRDVEALLRSLSSDHSVDHDVAHHVASASEQLDHALLELAETAQGLHPRQLVDGLGAALDALGKRSPVSVTVNVAGDPIEGEVAVAVYYVCAEGIANVAKHAMAHHASIDIACHDGRIIAEVRDDGIGGASEEKGTGLVGLTDRVAALGGTVSITSPEGGGTRLVAELPLGDQSTAHERLPH